MFCVSQKPLTITRLAASAIARRPQQSILKPGYRSDAISEAQPAPMTACDHDWRGHVFHQRVLPGAHVASIRLQQERLGVGRRSQTGPVVEDAPVTCVGRSEEHT